MTSKIFILTKGQRVFKFQSEAPKSFHERIEEVKLAKTILLHSLLESRSLNVNHIAHKLLIYEAEYDTADDTAERQQTIHKQE